MKKILDEIKFLTKHFETKSEADLLDFYDYKN